MSESPVWSVSDNRAMLTLAGLSAVVDLTQPEAGLLSVALGTSAPVDARLLAVELQDSQGTPATPTLADAYVRQADLVATYAPSAESPFRLQIYWRASVLRSGATCIDVQVSVQTNLLDSFPVVKVASTLAAAASGAEWLVPRDGQDDWIANPPSPPSPCVLFPSAFETYSFAQMAHPADVHHQAVGRFQEKENVRFEQELFASRLEKGVILRARLRGVFSHSPDARRQTAAAYADLLTAPPPLAT